MVNLTNTTQPELFVVGWFQYPKNLEVNYDVIELLFIIICILSLPLNAVLLAMIIKNPGQKIWSNTSIILGSISILNLASNGLTMVHQIDIIYRPDQPRLISNKILVNVLSMTYTKYYVSALLLAFFTYAMIVKPMKYKALCPKPRAMLKIILVLWFVSAGVFLIPPIFMNKSADILQTIVISISWSISILMGYFYSRILKTLCHRKKELKSTLNVTASRQGLRVVKQNSKLAAVLFIYISVKILITLPIGTCVLFLTYCSPCNHKLMIKIIIHYIPIAVFLSVFFPLHWLIGTPQYYKHIKKLFSKMLTCLRH